MKGLNASYRRLGERVKEKYPFVTDGRLEHELQRIRYSVSGDVRDLAGKVALDIGCGSQSTPDSGNMIFRLVQRLILHKSRADFHPWYCRILQEAGAHPLGLDIAKNDSEDFTGIQGDILDPNLFDQFEDGQFDVVNNYFTTAPRNSRKADQGSSPAIYLAVGKKNKRQLWADAQKKVYLFLRWELFIIGKF